MSDSENLPAGQEAKPLTSGERGEPFYDGDGGYFVCACGCDERCSEDDPSFQGETLQLDHLDLDAVRDVAEKASHLPSTLPEAREHIEDLKECLAIFEAEVKRTKERLEEAEKRRGILVAREFDKQTTEAIAKLGLKEAP